MSGNMILLSLLRVGLSPLWNPRRHLKTWLVVTSGVGGGIVAVSGWRPGVLLSMLQCTRQPPRQRIICPRMSTVLKVRNSGPEGKPRLGS